MLLEHRGPDRVARAFVSLAGNPLLQHEEYAIAIAEDNNIEIDDYNNFMYQLRT